MSPLEARQRDFAAALLDPARPVPAGLVGPDGKPSARRFAVYRNNVVVGLAAALAAAYPAVRRIVGQECFAAMARIHVAAAPPDSPIMLDYGRGFADFIGEIEPALALPYLRDVARVERAWTEAYHAPEAEPLDAITLLPPPAADLGHLRLDLHPSMRLVQSPFPALTIWLMNLDDGVPAPVDLDAGGENMLIVRPAAEVEVRSIPASVFDFVRALARGSSILAAGDMASRIDRGFDPTNALIGLIRVGAVVGYSPDSTDGGRAS